MLNNFSLWFLAALTIFQGVAANAATPPSIKDDFPQARAEALHRKVPIFVECWAPW
jgi:hypothetical protein